jgi:hypothetical protein
MQKKDTSKAKITYSALDLSAFFVENLIRGLGLSNSVNLKKTGTASAVEAVPASK